LLTLMNSPTIQKLIDLFSEFPTVGPRTAGRFVFHLLKLPKEEIEKLISAIIGLRSNVKICESCFNAFEPSPGQENRLCEICSNPLRDKSLLCITASETDLTAIENTKKYKGLYFVLGGTVSALKKTDLEKLRTSELEILLKNRQEIQEIILAMNATTEGEATGLYLERFLKPFNKKITRLGRGLPIGGELEYADEETLKAAFEGRK
jgi:recombination protein RecR